MPTSELPRHTGPVAFVALLAGFGVALFLARPASERAARAARASECPTNLELIAERLGAGAALPGPCGPWPAAPATEAPTSVATAPPCFLGLGFDPAVALWGRYEVRPDGTGWVATCALDLDGDGAQAVWQADDRTTAALRPGTED